MTFPAALRLSCPGAPSPPRTAAYLEGGRVSPSLSFCSGDGTPAVREWPLRRNASHAQPGRISLEPCVNIGSSDDAMSVPVNVRKSATPIFYDGRLP